MSDYITDLVIAVLLGKLSQKWQYLVISVLPVELSQKWQYLPDIMFG
jgi:hypothetical protein